MFTISAGKWFNNRKKKEEMMKLSAELQTMSKINKQVEENEGDGGGVYTDEDETDKTG